jgi:hypothetical protein
MPTVDDLFKASKVSIGAEGEAKKQLVQITNYALSVAYGLAPSETEPELQLPRKVGVGMALSAAVQSVSALLSAGSVQCNRAVPPADIEMKVNGSGRLVYRCYHTPPHEWDLNGSPLP